jgi:hypothetical protein
MVRMAAVSDLTGQEFLDTQFKGPQPVGEPTRLRGFARTFGVVGTAVGVATYPVDVYRFGFREASKSAIEGLVDPLGMLDEDTVGCAFFGDCNATPPPMS